VLFVTHSIAEAIRIGNRILLLSPHPGRVKAEIEGVEAARSSPDGAARLEQQIHELLFQEWTDPPADALEPALQTETLHV
jgi:NitT/TauT family transport system ATP-binding protein